MSQERCWGLGTQGGKRDAVSVLQEFLVGKVSLTLKNKTASHKGAWELSMPDSLWLGIKECFRELGFEQDC